MSRSGTTAGTTALTRAVTSRRYAWLFALLPLLLAGAFIGMVGEADRPTGVTDNLPAGFDSTEAAVLQAEISDGEASAAITLWTADNGTLSDDQLAELKVLAGDNAPFVVAEDAAAAYTIAPVQAATSEENRGKVADLRTKIAEEAPNGVTAALTGPAAFKADFGEVFAGADVKLLAATAGIVAVLLIVTYRSPVLWIIPLAVVGVADRFAALAATHVMKNFDGLAWDPSVVGILSVLVFGAGTNYALLLISRYRDELKIEDDRRLAMARALHATTESVVFAASTVVLGTLTLTLSVMPTTRGLGVACAVGVVVAAFFALVSLPAALSCFGRWIFWPRTPRRGDELLIESTGFWHKVGLAVDKRPKSFVVGTLVLLAVLSAGLLDMRTGLRQADQFLETPDAVVVSETLAEHFPAGTADPLQVLTKADPEAVATAVTGVDGVIRAEQRGGRDGTSQVNVVLGVNPGTPESTQAVKDVRDALEQFDDTYVTGGDANVIDETDAANHDRLRILPAVVLLVLIGLGLLLRSIVAPIILVATVVATYGAALGTSWWIFRFVFDFPAVHQQVPLTAFLFLVALGVDYNIFLITRARQEARTFGHRQGMLRALTATGGVITSAGILLAAVFAVLGVLPLVMLAQIGTIICVGVLLDTLVVRTVLVPAIAITLGEKFWWPRRPAHLDAAPKSSEGSRDVDVAPTVEA
ncbi:MMPL family transporter [Nocardioides yefusunii]|uniref:MMPL family transporter n=1 Tax=Nocardioides yefusunii TaxID=2500546 RepID=A0ABW1R0X6_9ACTN|nr:MMPL family transporter [Nocardioides yefusunii]